MWMDLEHTLRVKPEKDYLSSANNSLEEIYGKYFMLRSTTGVILNV